MKKKNDLHCIIAVNVKLARLNLGWSQEELAGRCNLHRTYIGAIERGERNITVNTLAKLSEALDSSLGALLGLDARR